MANCDGRSRTEILLVFLEKCSLSGCTAITLAGARFSAFFSFWAVCVFLSIFSIELGCCLSSFLFFPAPTAASLVVAVLGEVCSQPMRAFPCIPDADADRFGRFPFFLNIVL